MERPAELTGLSGSDQAWLAWMAHFDADLSASMRLQTTRPQTLAYALTDSPCQRDPVLTTGRARRSPPDGRHAVDLGGAQELLDHASSPQGTNGKRPSQGPHAYTA
ncbi:hypothetical protein [Micromonospora sp. DT47]|uniref:hypothetical protein n=1 Tax=Micromonospora sp. DT47 TaxID=3393431 RepID=UPI003CF8F760